MLGRYIDLGNPVSDHPLNQGLNGWWLPLPGMHGWRISELKGGQHAVFTNEPFWTSGPNGFQAVSFDGSNDYCDATSFPWPGGKITIAFWIWTAAAGSNPACFSFGHQNTPNRCHGHIPWTDDVLYWDYGNASEFDGRISTDFSGRISKWTHVTLQSAGAGGAFKAIYFNGVIVVTETSTISAGPGALTGATFGRGTADTTRYEAQLLTDLRIYNRVLSSSEVSRLYDQSIQGHPETLRRFSRTAYLFAPTSAVPDTVPVFRKQKLVAKSKSLSVWG